MRKKKQKINFEKLKYTRVSNQTDPFGKWCKVYHDGSHFVAVPSSKKSDKKTCRRNLPVAKCVDGKLVDVFMYEDMKEEKAYFDEYYAFLLSLGIVKPKTMFSLLKDGMLEKFPNLPDIDAFIDENISRQRHNYFSRLKRFKRKANLNIWNKFVTITYDPKKHTELTFRKKLRKCLSNLHSRRGWNYMGVFELAPETNRLHFHAIMYIPENEMVGIVEEKQDYSTAQHKMQITHSNSFFADAFGRNDFEELTEADLKSGRTLEYLTKYLSKTNERIIYSRGVPAELEIYIEERYVACVYIDYVNKFVLFDDCINKTYGYIRLLKYKQASIYDYGLCCS